MTTTASILWVAGSWLLIIPLAIANGLLREFYLRPRLGIAWAHPLSGILLMACIALVTWFMVGRLGPRPMGSWLTIGIIWGVATVGFELLLLYRSGKGMDELVAQYTFVDYNIWPFVLLWTVSAPLVMALWRHG